MERFEILLLGYIFISMIMAGVLLAITKNREKRDLKPDDWGFACIFSACWPGLLAALPFYLIIRGVMLITYRAIKKPK